MFFCQSFLAACLFCVQPGEKQHLPAWVLRCLSCQEIRVLFQRAMPLSLLPPSKVAKCPCSAGGSGAGGTGAVSRPGAGTAGHRRLGASAPRLPPLALLPWGCGSPASLTPAFQGVWVWSDPELNSFCSENERFPNSLPPPNSANPLASPKAAAPQQRGSLLVPVCSVGSGERKRSI